MDLNDGTFATRKMLVLATAFYNLAYVGMTAGTKNEVMKKISQEWNDLRINHTLSWMAHKAQRTEAKRLRFRNK